MQAHVYKMSCNYFNLPGLKADPPSFHLKTCFFAIPLKPLPCACRSGRHIPLGLHHHRFPLVQSVIRLRRFPHQLLFLFKVGIVILDVFAYTVPRIQPCTEQVLSKYLLKGVSLSSFYLTAISTCSEMLRHN